MEDQLNEVQMICKRKSGTRGGVGRWKNVVFHPMRCNEPLDEQDEWVWMKKVGDGGGR